MSSIMTLYALDKHVHGCFFSLHRVCKLTATGLVCAIVAGLTGCATSAELDSLRAEVAKIKATALRAEAEVSRTQNELAALKVAAKPAAAFTEPSKPPTASSAKPAGYKWGSLSR